MTSRQLRYPSPFLWFLLFPINKLFVMAEYHRRVLRSLDTVRIFYWLFRVLHDDRRRHNFLTIPQTFQPSFPVLIFFDFFLFFKTRWSNGLAISFLCRSFPSCLQLLCLVRWLLNFVVSLNRKISFRVTCILLIPPPALARDHASFGSNQNQTFDKVSSEHIYQPDLISRLRILSEPISCTLSQCD